jgi:putative restriction endonuclease
MGWFNYAGPDDADNGLALCALHHRLFDRGVLGLSDSCRLHVSSAYSA